MVPLFHCQDTNYYTAKFPGSLSHLPKHRTAFNVCQIRDSGFFSRGGQIRGFGDRSFPTKPQWRSGGWSPSGGLGDEAPVEVWGTKPPETDDMFWKWCINILRPLRASTTLLHKNTNCNISRWGKHLRTHFSQVRSVCIIPVRSPSSKLRSEMVSESRIRRCMHVSRRNQQKSQGKHYFCRRKARFRAFSGNSSSLNPVSGS